MVARRRAQIRLDNELQPVKYYWTVMREPRSTSGSHREGLAGRFPNAAHPARSVELNVEQHRDDRGNDPERLLPLLTDRFCGALLGAAIGDALGALVERTELQEPDPLGRILSHPPDELRFEAPTLTTLATARSLIERRGFDASHVQSSLATHFEREPWRFHTLDSTRQFDSTARAGSWEQAAASFYGGDGAYSNDAAARVTPIGLFFHAAPARAAEAARSTAFTTHAHPIGQDGAGMQAATVAEIVRTIGLDGGCQEVLRGMLSRIRETAATRRFRDLVDYLLAGSVHRSNVIRLLGNGKEAHRSVTTALFAFVAHPTSFSDGLGFALALRGASRTIGAMTGALCGAAVGATRIPSEWRSRLERADELIVTAEQLLAVCLDQHHTTSTAG